MNAPELFHCPVVVEPPQVNSRQVCPPGGPPSYCGYRHLFSPSADGVLLFVVKESHGGVADFTNQSICEIYQSMPRIE
jgi:hypothetical protein